jgi:Multicopper oxidase
MHRDTVENSARTEAFPSEVAGLAEAQPPKVVEVPDGGRMDLEIAPVVKRLGDATVRMLAYSGSVPGPVIKVRQGSEIVVDVSNRGDLETTVHWHGLRLDNRYAARTRPSTRSRSVSGSNTACSSRIRASTGTTRTSARTTARRWACTGTSSSSRRTRSTGRRCTGRSC